MRILERYILSEFLKLLAIALSAFMVLFVLVDLFENVDNLMKYKVPAAASLAFFIYKTPFILSQVAPVAVLVSVLVALGMLAKHGEITAMKAGGIYLFRTILPLLTAGLAISASVVLINEYVTPAGLKKADSFKARWFGVQGGTVGKTGVWIRTGNGIFNIRHADIPNERLYGVTFYEIEKPFKVKSRAITREAVWDDHAWKADSATLWVFNGGGEARSEEISGIRLEGLAAPEDLANVENLQKNMGFLELWNYINSLEADGYDASKYKLDLYGKITFPLVNVIMVILGVPFALKTGRYGGIAAGVGISIVIAFSYWIVTAMTKSLTTSGLLTPLIAAIFPDALFLAIGALMYGYVRQ